MIRLCTCRYIVTIWKNLGDRERFKYHINKTLEIEPWNVKARNDERNQTLIPIMDQQEMVTIEVNDYRDTRKNVTDEVLLNGMTTDTIINCTPI